MKGSSRQAILKFLMANYQVGGDAIKINAHLKMALKRMVKSNDLKQLKGTGASGRFRLGEKAKKSTEGKPRKRTTKAKKTGKPKKSKFCLFYCKVFIRFLIHCVFIARTRNLRVLFSPLVIFSDFKAF